MFEKELSVAGEETYHLLKRFMKRMNPNKIRYLEVHFMPISPKPLKIFATNPFPNLHTLSLAFRKFDDTSYCNLDYLSNLTQLIQLDLSDNNDPSIRNNNNWNWLSKLINLEIVYLDCGEPLQVKCMKVLTSLPKLRELEIPLEILDSSNEYLQLFSPFKSLTSLSICTDSEKVILEGELKLIQFPTISSLEVIAFTQVGGFKGKFDSHIQSQHIIPIFASNPQIHTIAANITQSSTNQCGSCLAISAIEMSKILPYAPNLVEYNIEKIDPIITCCAMMPTPLINVYPHHIHLECDCPRYHTKFHSNSARQELLKRLLLHVSPNYNCKYKHLSPINK